MNNAQQTADDSPGPALSLVVAVDVPSGLRALDAIIKEADVQVLATGTIHNGLYMIAFGGQVEPVQLSYEKALSIVRGHVVDDVMLPHAHERIWASVKTGKVNWPCPGDTLGVLQTSSPPTMLRAVDVALKGAWVELVELRLGDGLGGKAVATLWGETHDVQAAIQIAHEVFAASHRCDATSAMIANADEQTARAVAGGTRFFKEWRG